MTFMAWSRHFETGIDTVDRQHRALVDLVNQAAPLLAAAGSTGVGSAGHLLDQLGRYATVHFQDEERLMQDAHLDPAYLAHHHHTHEGFVQAVTTMRQQAVQEGQLTGNELLRFLTSWLTFHILAEDQSMARQIRAMQAGMTAQQAWAAETQTDADAPHAVYTAALIDLFGVVTQRNRSLTEVNERLQHTQAQLAQANRVLEDRVAERTRELAQANDSLRAEQAALQASLSRLEQTQQQLLQSEKMAAVGQLAAGVAHEINNPVGFVNANLASLGSYTDRLFQLVDAQAAMLAASPPLPADHPAALALEQAQAAADLGYLRQDLPDLLRESLDGLQRVKRIVNDLREFSHVGHDGWEPADLNQGLESTLNVVWNDIKFKAEITRELSPLPPVTCIASQINQVFLNLLVNAGQAIAGHGHIGLASGTLEREGQPWVWVEVRDDGHGMPEPVQRRVFEPFFTTKPVGQGTGLGLSVSWEIVQRHHGHLTVRSTEGTGTTFRCELPCQPPASLGAPS
jgi:two-component system NtrC family sensor kinase